MTEIEKALEVAGWTYQLITDEESGETEEIWSHPEKSWNVHRSPCGDWWTDR